MANDTILTDEYVAELLAKDADDRSIKYSSMGLEAYRSEKVRRISTSSLLRSQSITDPFRRHSSPPGLQTKLNPTRASSDTSSRRPRTTTQLSSPRRQPSLRLG